MPGQRSGSAVLPEDAPVSPWTVPLWIVYEPVVCGPVV